MIIAALHFEVPEFNPNDRFVSDYARDRRFGWMINLAFVWLGIAAIALGAGLLMQFEARLVPTLLALAGGSIALLSVVVTAPRIRYEVTHCVGWEGLLHDVFTSVGFGMFTLSMVLFGVTSPTRLPIDWQWARAVGLSQFSVALAVILAQIVLSVRARKGHSSKGPGLTERALILLFFEWVFFLGFVILGS